jgi:DMSO/TMAO reductase YedYZ molybdopterin-dependent catalytic subunit
MKSQRLLMGDALAREYTAAQMSPVFRANGSTSVDDAGYARHLASGFAQWSLQVDGLVKRPLALPLSALQAMTQRRQITRHDCVEGWSAIGQWQGPPLGAVLAMAGLLPAARYAVFHCADRLGGAPYYESIDLVDAFHPQTILAWQMNGRPLPVEHGAPLRLRVERQLGYKQAKYVMRIELSASLSGLFGGKGGYWEDAGDYAWYAGI